MSLKDLGVRQELFERALKLEFTTSYVVRGRRSYELRVSDENLIQHRLAYGKEPEKLRQTARLYCLLRKLTKVKEELNELLANTNL